MKKLFLLLTITAFCCMINIIAKAQNQANKWYFGLNAGLDFATNPPTILNNGASTSYEGGSSIADAAGNLLFYTNANTIWNQLHVPMANGTGLMGGQSSVQSSIIVKQPGNSNIYFTFTQESGNQANGFRYSVVDMSLAGGQGSVTVKNVLLQTPSTERLAAVKHCNGSDVWVITHDMNSNIFRNFLVTVAGVNISPVLSAIGSSVSGNAFIGSIKVSPNGRKIAMTEFLNGTGNCKLFDFDAATGIVSNQLILNNNINNPYGIEFSPDNTKLYSACFGAGAQIFQWDVCAVSNAAIIASQYMMPTNMGNSCGSFQLAPNGKIYIAFHNVPQLGAINNPNLSGAACNYTNFGQALGSGTSQLGLPNFVSSYFKPLQGAISCSFANRCTEATFSVPIVLGAGCTALTNYTSLAWQFGDPASPNNTSSVSPTTHSFSAPGVYTVQLVLYSSCGSDTLQQVVSTIAPTVNSTGNFTICAGQAATLTATGANTYSWSNGNAGATITVSPTVTTTYTVSGFNAGGCSGSNSLTVFVAVCAAENELSKDETFYNTYPNPAERNLLFETTKNCRLVICDLLGKTVHDHFYEAGKHEIKIDLENGIYSLRMISGSHVQTTKIKIDTSD